MKHVELYLANPLRGELLSERKMRILKGGGDIGNVHEQQIKNILPHAQVVTIMCTKVLQLIHHHVVFCRVVLVVVRGIAAATGKRQCQ